MPGNVGALEIAIVFVIVLIIFGPKKLPELGRSLGRGIREFKGSISGEHDDEPSSSNEIAKPEIEKPQPTATVVDESDEPSKTSTGS